MSIRIFGIGELLWDLLPSSQQLGGAPANFIHHAQCLGIDACLIARIGNDALGKEVLKKFKQKHLSTELLQIDEQKPTGTVDVSYSSPGVPEYTIHENVAWDNLAVTQQALSALSSADAICFGSLSQRNPVSRATIYQLLLAAPKNTVRVFDINLRQAFYSKELLEKSLQIANILKLNNDEMDILTDLFHIEGTLEKKIIWLAQTYNLQTIALTRGSEGSMLFNQGNWSIMRPKNINAVDTLGAGDAFSAALVVGLLQGLKVDAAHEIASEVASYVCSQLGAMPLLPKVYSDQIIGQKESAPSP